MLAQVFPEALGIVFDHDVPDAGTRRQCRPPGRDAWKVVKDRLRHRGIDDGEVAEERGVVAMPKVAPAKYGPEPSSVSSRWSRSRNAARLAAAPGR